MNKFILISIIICFLSAFFSVSALAYNYSNWQSEYDSVLKMHSYKGTTIYGVEKNGLFGLINHDGKIIVPIKYKKENVGFIDNRDIQVVDDSSGRNNTKVGVYSINSEVVIPIRFEKVRQLTINGEYYEVCNFNDYCGVMQRGGNILIPIAYDQIISLSGSKLVLIKDDLSIIYDYRVQKRINYPFQVYQVGDYDNLVVKTNGKFGLFNIRLNSYILPPEYDSMHMRRGSATYEFSKDGVNYFANEYGTAIVKNLTGQYYSSVGKFYTAKKNGKEGLYLYNNDTHQNMLIIPFEYDEIRQQNDILFRFKKNGKCGISIYNKNTNSFREILPIIYDDIDDDRNLYIFSQNGYKGAIDKNTLELLLVPKYERIDRETDYKYQLYLNGKYAVFDVKDKSITKFKSKKHKIRDKKKTKYKRKNSFNGFIRNIGMSFSMFFATFYELYLAPFFR